MRILWLLLVLCPFVYSFRYHEFGRTKVAKQHENMMKMKAVKDKIMDGYDKYLLPRVESLNYTHVDTDLIPRQIIDVDETKGLFVLDSILCLTWVDPRLMWNNFDFNGTLILPPDLVWLPDLHISNSHNMPLNPASDVLLTCNHKGLVSWCPPITTQTFCPSLMEATYPYDVIYCNFTMTSKMQDEDIMAFGWLASVSLNKFDNTHQRWELLNNGKIRAEVDMLPRDPEYPKESIHDLVYSFPLRRRDLPEIEVSAIPCLLVMLLTLSVFWMPPNSSNKIPVLGIVLVVLTALIIYVAWSTKSPLGVVFATSFLQSTMCIVVATFLLQILIIFNLCNCSGSSRPPPSVVKLLRGTFGKLVCLRCSLDDNNQATAGNQIKEDASVSIDASSPKGDWMLLAAFLDRVFFVIILIVMVTVHHL